MTNAQFATLVRLKTRTSSTTFTDADIITFMRNRQEEIAEAIIRTDEDILLVPQTTSLVLNQREYPYPADILSRIKRVEAKLDGTNWLKLSETDITKFSYPIASETDITYRFSNEQDHCFYDLSRKSLIIYSGSITAVTDGLKLWCDTYPTAITDLALSTDMSVDPSTTTHGIPKAMHRLWATGVVIDYKSSREKPIPLTESELAYEKDLQRAIETLKHGNLDRVVRVSTPYNDGSSY